MAKRRLFTGLFWLDAIERSIATFIEVLSAFLVADATFASIDWQLSFSIAGMATLAALIKSVGAAAKADTDTASLVVDTKPL
jgi:hypothetical protein